MIKITHAAGHALVTPGKQSPDGYKEWQVTSEIVKLVMLELENYERVIQKRIDDSTGKSDIPLKKRCELINGWGANVHIDYHLNAYGSGWNNAGGTETYTYTTKPKEAAALAEKIQTNLVKELGFRNRGIKAADFQMVRETKMTAILIEFAFMTNHNEAIKMRTEEYQKKAAKSVVDGLVAQYGLKKKPAVSSTVDVVYRIQVGAFSDIDNAKSLVEELKAKGYQAIIV
ncbi:N-acetylmuramoyl-L-alanine amidase [Bacillus sp. EB106-08-02-XG196]|jgi:N-acetylmuramoyl-L-alanine amidase|uniref:N-acetylmuramoyl-L-alanine amidase n=1 Tax=Bacillus sp. EB106-08-02-XG196 TaxID=2737049 RepID=UPI0015C4C8D6|nr:N-acetylmuramoyl-L-alanine amidase [Bacillus sp. EB106-08-02-XG196]NWQ41451.1 N-acetylmuramoyl-L-alanine amidase [Bacillus sp. EB106-08-02-XG196]